MTSSSHSSSSNTLATALSALFEHWEEMNKAAKLREKRRLERLFPGAEIVVRFRTGGKDYLFARMPDGKVRAALNGRVLEKPPKHIVRFARRMICLQDVDAVHAL